LSFEIARAVTRAYADESFLLNILATGFSSVSKTQTAPILVPM